MAYNYKQVDLKILNLRFRQNFATSNSDTRPSQPSPYERSTSVRVTA